MIESLVSLLVSLIVFAFGYGKMTERVKNVESNLKGLEEDVKGINQINITLKGIEKDIHYIKQQLETQTQDDENNN